MTSEALMNAPFMLLWAASNCNALSQELSHLVLIPNIDTMKKMARSLYSILTDVKGYQWH